MDLVSPTLVGMQRPVEFEKGVICYVIILFLAIMMQKFFWLQTGPWGTTHVALISTGWVVNSKQSSKILINEKWLNYLLTILLALCWSFAGLPRVGSWGTWRAGVPVPMAVEWFWPW